MNNLPALEQMEESVRLVSKLASQMYTQVLELTFDEELARAQSLAFANGIWSMAGKMSNEG